MIVHQKETKVWCINNYSFKSVFSGQLYFTYSPKLCIHDESSAGE